MIEIVRDMLPKNDKLVYQLYGITEEERG